MENKAHALAAGVFVLLIGAILVAMAIWLTRDAAVRHTYEVSTSEAVSGLQPQAAVRYRGMKGDRDRSASAEKRLTAVLMLAMSKLEITRAEPKAASSALTKLLLIAFFLAGSLLVLAYLLRT